MRGLATCVVLVACSSNSSMPPGPPMPDAPPAVSAIDQCFTGLTNPNHPHPSYDQFHPTWIADCTGTNVQDISGVEKLMFLGDSITAGTPPTLATDYYRTLVGNAMTAKFCALEIKDCSKWGAKTA